MGQVTVRAQAADAIALTIASGQSVSDSADLNGRGLVRLDMPSAWTAAGITVQVSEDNATWRDLYDADGTELALTVAASRAVILDPAKLPGLRWVRLRSGTAAAPVAQLAARTLTLLARAL